MVVKSGSRALQTDLGEALRVAWWSYAQRIDAELAAAGLPGREFPLNYLFALCGQPEPMTISEMGRQFAVSRQAASKITAELRRRGYVAVAASATDQREKVVEVTAKAVELVTARRRAAAALDREIGERLGRAGVAELQRGLETIAEVSVGKKRAEFGNLYRSPRMW
ncbi:MarR family winged helix-turn-helix transcriptional regulator [Mycobacterium montefiorense]|nr:MarR family transcriptional regulator [Mycobacterium montefiorense]MCV7429278.1 MarR family transcriptional regulator [Mycobacterium montefiorense]